MDAILGSIKALRGVHDVCIYHQKQLVGSTFATHQQAAIHQAALLLDKIFTNLKIIRQDHEEIYLSVGKQQLVAFQIQQKIMIVLLTDKRINIPLINNGIKSVTERLILFTSELDQNAYAVVEKLIEPDEVTAFTIIHEEDIDLLPILDQLQTLLLEYFGPVSSFMLSDALESWRRTGITEYKYIHQLIAILVKEFDSKHEKRDFQYRADAIIHAAAKAHAH